MQKAKSGFKIVGTFVVDILRPGGSKITNTYKNLVVNYGLVNLAGVIAGTPFPTTFTHIAMGDSATTPALGDTALGNETLRTDAVVTQLPNPQDNQVQFQKSFTQGAVVGTYREAGIFDGPSGGNMFNRVVFPDFVVGSQDTLTLTWVIEIRNA